MKTTTAQRSFAGEAPGDGNRFRSRFIRTVFLAACAISLLLRTQGSAQEFGGVRFLGQFTPPSGGSYTAGCWGWTDTTTGREYALLGNLCGTAIVEITDVGAMVERDFIDGVCNSWREIGVHENYAYVVSEGGGGVQIIDLSYLPDSAHLVKSFMYSSGSSNITRSHTVHVKDGYLYLNGGADWSPGGIVIFDLADPENPAFRSVYTRAYMHDSFVRNDTIYGAGIYGVGLDVIDATVKTSPTYLYTITYPGSGTHNAAITGDGMYALTTDEINSTPKTLKIWRISSAPSFSKVAEYVGSPTAIVHNVFVKDNLAIMSYYTAGIRILDISDPTNPVEIGGYDTYPANDNSAYTGAWSVYPFFPSGKIIIGDMVSGMYVVDLNPGAPQAPSPFAAYSDYQTPNSVTLNWTDPTTNVAGGPLSGFKLHVYRNSAYIAEVDSGVETYTDTGRTEHNYYTYTIRAVAGPESSNVSSSGAYAGGHSNPKTPTSFQVHDGTDGVLLQWVNPSRQFDNTPLNDFAYVLIYRDEVLTDSVAQSPADTGQVRSYTDSVLGYHSYHIRVRDDESPVHYSLPTASGSGYGGAYLAFSESFDSVIAPLQTSGGWDTTSSIAASGTTCVTDSRLSVYSPGETNTLTFPPVILGDDPMLSFKHIAIVAFGDFAFLEISRDNRQTYSVVKVYNWVDHPQWADASADPGDWETVTLDLAAYANDTINVRFRLVANGVTEADGWFVDDVYIGPSSVQVEEPHYTSAGWNIVSLPLRVPDGSIDSLFPGATTSAFAYDGVYSSVDSLENGNGYWLKFDSATGNGISGTTILKDTIDLNEDWNLIGAISQDIPVTAVTSVPPGIIASQFYSYDAGYNAETILQPGDGYWVRSSQPGMLILSIFSTGMPGAMRAAAAPPYTAAALRAAIPSAGDQDVDPRTAMNSLTITDAAGDSRTLYMTMMMPAEMPRGLFDLPPLPPPGAFDIRFASGRDVGVFDGRSGDGRVLIQGARAPLKISWRMCDGETARLKTGASMRDISGEGSTLLTGAPTSLDVDFGPATPAGVPSVFTLHQNYPNPFNPSTVFEFDLPESGTARLVIFNTLGQHVATIVNESLPAGTHSRVWDASAGRDMPGGVYHAVLSLTDGNASLLFRDSRKLLLLR